MAELKFRQVRREATHNNDERVPVVAPVGPEPRAVRIIRPGHAPVVLALVKTREYHLGRSQQADLYFDDARVSNEHASLYLCEQASAWVYRDLGSVNGSFASRAHPDGKCFRVLPGVPIALIAGYSIDLGQSLSRLEFMEEVPPEAIGAPVPTIWKSEAGKLLEEAIVLAAGHTLPTVLIGPTGSGKTYAARRIHELSRRSGEFVSINCGHLPSDRLHLGSELIGHVKGAFTGAYEPRLGKLFAADKGTLFLDEVDALTSEAQTYFLTLLEGREELVPLGAPLSKRRPRPDFRVLCASQKGLKAASIRPDLAERLGAEFIHIPGLEQRREDMPLLIERFLQVWCAEVQAEVNLSQDALSFLMERRWLGQVRELHESLQAVVHRRLAEQVRDGIAARSFVLGKLEFERYFESRAKGMGATDVAIEPAIEPPKNPLLIKHPKYLLREDLEGALRATKGNKTHAAKLLGVALNTLKRKMKQHGLLGQG